MSQEADSKGDDAYFRACEENLLHDLAEDFLPVYLAEAVADLEMPRILDVACGIGQALLLLAARHGGSGIGLDVSARAVRLGTEIQIRHRPQAHVSFAQARAELLPFPRACFDVVICRLALPYTDNTMVLAEVARVLRPGGVFMLRIHHLRYYLRQVRQSLLPLRILPLFHALRVLFAGSVYHLTGTQPRLRAFKETFQTRWLLSRELARNDLTIIREFSDSTPEAPDFLIQNTRNRIWIATGALGSSIRK